MRSRCCHCSKRARAEERIAGEDEIDREAAVDGRENAVVERSEIGEVRLSIGG